MASRSRPVPYLLVPSLALLLLLAAATTTRAAAPVHPSNDHQIGRTAREDTPVESEKPKTDGEQGGTPPAAESSSKPDPPAQNETQPQDGEQPKDDPKPEENAQSESSAKPEEQGESNAALTSEDQALSQFNLYLSYSDSLMSPPYDNIDDLFKGGQLMGKWGKCIREPFVEDDCFIDDEYSDSLGFEFGYGEAEYAFASPVVEVSGGKAKPEVVEFYTDDIDMVGEFIVEYKCQDTSDVYSVITLTMKVTENHSIRVVWGKRCRTGKNDAIVFGYMTDEGEQSEFTSDTNLVVPDTDPSTTIFLTMKSPARHQSYQSPKVISKDEGVVKATTRGYQGIIYDDSSTFTITYECMAQGSAKIVLEIGIPPWDPLSATFVKECSGKGGGKAHTGLSIGTVDMGHDVVENGNAVGEYYTPYDNMFSGSPPVIGADVFTKQYYIMNSPDGDDITIDSVTISVEAPSVLYARLQTDAFDYMGRYGGTLSPGDTRVLKMHFTCRAKGSTHVVVTFAMLKYSNIEFAITKECVKPQRHEESGFLTTAGSVMAVLTIVTLVGVGMMGYACIKSRRGDVKYQPTATS